jgi:diguanylate cyclase (GGDEF)-like protein
MSFDASKKILIVDDLPSNLTILGNVLNAAGYKVLPVSSGAQALRLLENHQPDLMLLDIRMPVMDGYELCERIKTMPAHQGTPILFISANDDVGSKVKAFTVGAVDYISKPFEEAEVLARVSTHLRLSSLQRELSSKILALEEANRTIQELSIRDELTKLYNRRYFNQQAEFLLEQTKRSPQPISLMIADIDSFKRINDTFGHGIGDVVLREVAKILQHQTRATDLVARYGGEEFVLLMPSTNLMDAVKVCDLLREQIEHHNWLEVHHDLNVTISMGVSQFEAKTDLQTLVTRADEKLYEAKNSGKNKVCC